MTKTAEPLRLQQESCDPLSPSVLFGELSVLKVTFAMKVENRSPTPAYQGSAWRGLIGWGLRETVCRRERIDDCRTCAEHESCPYFILFEMKSRLPGLSESPRGYIVYAPPFSEGTTQNLQVTLFGRCTGFLPFIVRSLVLGQGMGLGAQRERYEIESVLKEMPGENLEPLSLKSSLQVGIEEGIPLRVWLAENRVKNRDQLRLRLTTPVRLRRKGAYLNRMDWHFFLASLARRLEALHALHAGGDAVGRDCWGKLMERFERVSIVESGLCWFDYGRYSNRQRRKVPMGGLVGIALLNGAEPFWHSWWHAAALVHVGKGASMGLGKVDIL